VSNPPPGKLRRRSGLRLCVYIVWTKVVVAFRRAESPAAAGTTERCSAELDSNGGRNELKGTFWRSSKTPASIRARNEPRLPPRMCGIAPVLSEQRKVRAWPVESLKTGFTPCIGFSHRTRSFLSTTSHFLGFFRDSSGRSLDQSRIYGALADWHRSAQAAVLSWSATISRNNSQQLSVLTCVDPTNSTIVPSPTSLL
jgi:hypothetical protein